MEMLSGRVIFIAGAALLALALLLGVIFLIFRPKYRPGDKAAVRNGETEPLHSSYPTQAVTKRRDGTDSLPTVALPEDDATVLLPRDEGTIKL